MPVINETKKLTLAQEVKLCENVFSRAIGLMFSRKNVNLGLVFPFKKEKKVSLHMWFVFYPIDVLFLDKNKKVVEIVHRFKPFSFYKPEKKAKYVVELPAGIVSWTKTETGDIISF